MTGLVVGIDLSLTATGVAAFGEHTSAPIVATVKTAADDNTVFGFTRRCWQIAEGIADTVGHVAPDLVIIEGLSYHSKSSSIDKIHASWWIVQDALEVRGWPAALKVTPNQRAKYATGKGNASKDSVLIETVKRYPDLNIRNNNEADAVILAAMGMRALGEAVESSLPRAHLEAVRDLVVLMGGDAA
jgi:Holliday junction resolvasome RuvABC endonuclease subunit